MGFQDLKNEGSLEFSISIFLGLGSNFDLVLASVHQIRVYASKQPIRDINEDGVKEVTRDLKSLALN